MSKPKSPNVEMLVFENEQEKIYFSFPLFKTNKDRLAKDASLEDRFIFLLKQAYSVNKLSDLFKGFKAESVESVVTGVNFLIRYGVCWVQYENKGLISSFYKCVENLFEEDEGKYVPYAMYITKGLIKEQETGALLVKLPEEVIYKYNKTKEAWQKESEETV